MAKADSGQEGVIVGKPSFGERIGNVWEERSARRIGRKLARYTIRKANQGYIGEEIPAKTSRFMLPIGGDWGVFYPEGTYETAEALVAEQGFVVTYFDAPGSDPLSYPLHMIIDAPATHVIPK